MVDPVGMLKLTLLGLALLVGLLPVGSEEAPGFEQASRLAGDSLALVTPSIAQPGQVEEAVSLRGGAFAGWWASVQKDIGRSEYQVTWQDRTYLPDLPAVYQAPNRAHNLRTYFTPAGVRIIPRTGDGAAWEWGFTLAGYGYEGAIRPVASATVSAHGNRIEYRRGGLTEWYVNDERGLEQGFRLDAPHVGESGGEGAGYLVLELAVTGDLSASLTEDGLAIELTTQGGVRVLRYGSLYAEDAAGRRLPAQLALESSRISVLVDAGSAIYPIVVDPLVTSPSWTAESDQAGAFFGISVGTAGDVNGDGYSDVIVGAPLYDNGESDEGRAFVYHGSPAGLSAAAGWTAESDQASAQFGVSAGTAGDVNGDGYSDVIVGAHWYDNGEFREGRAFVHHGSPTGLSATAGWTAEGDQPDAQFGSSVGATGDVNGDGYSDVIVGAHGYDNGELHEGWAFVYHGEAPAIADLSVSKSDSPDPVIAGTGLTYTLKVANNGLSDATGVVLADILPPDVTFVSSTPGSSACTHSAGAVTCALGDLASGATTTVAVQVTVDRSTRGTLTNTATVTANEADRDTTNNTTTQDTLVNVEADLSVAKDDSSDPVIAGTSLNYTLTVTNNGPSDATGVALTDALPSNVIFSSASTGCNYVAGTHEIGCTIGNLASGTSTAVAIEVTVLASSTPFVISNTTSVTGNEKDPNDANNTATERTIVFPHSGVPGLSWWALIAMSVLTGSLVLWRLRRTDGTVPRKR